METLGRPGRAVRGAVRCGEGCWGAAGCGDRAGADQTISQADRQAGRHRHNPQPSAVQAGSGSIEEESCVRVRRGHSESDRAEPQRRGGRAWPRQGSCCLSCAYANGPSRHEHGHPPSPFSNALQLRSPALASKQASKQACSAPPRSPPFENARFTARRGSQHRALHRRDACPQVKSPKSASSPMSAPHHTAPNVAKILSSRLSNPSGKDTHLRLLLYICRAQACLPAPSPPHSPSSLQPSLCHYHCILSSWTPEISAPRNLDPSDRRFRSTSTTRRPPLVRQATSHHGSHNAPFTFADLVVRARLSLHTPVHLPIACQDGRRCFGVHDGGPGPLQLHHHDHSQPFHPPRANAVSAFTAPV